MRKKMLGIGIFLVTVAVIVVILTKLALTEKKTITTGPELVVEMRTKYSMGWNAGPQVEKRRFQLFVQNQEQNENILPELLESAAPGRFKNPKFTDALEVEPGKVAFHFYDPISRHHPTMLVSLNSESRLQAQMETYENWQRWEIARAEKIRDPEGKLKASIESDESDESESRKEKQ